VESGQAKAFAAIEIEMISINKGSAKITFSPSSTVTNFKGTIELTAAEVFDP